MAEPLPQLTIKAIVLGCVLAAILAGANAYLGLFAGLTVSASIPAAVISMAVLRLFKESNILENNIVQTIASAGEALAAGAIFTLPALIILDYWSVFDYWWVLWIAGLGGLLGVLFTIPLRRSLIIEQKLPFPEGTATAEVLRAGDAPGRGVKFLAWAAVIGGVTKLAETGFKLWAGTAQAAVYVGQSTIAYIGTNLSPALISVGYIIGLNVAVLVMLGGAISWWVAIPIYSTYFLADDLAAQVAGGAAAGDMAYAIWAAKIRYLGVGAMLIGGIWALITMRRSIWSGIQSGLARRAVPTDASGGYDHTQHDVSMRIVLVGVVLFVVPLFAVYYSVIGTVGVAGALTIIMVITGFLFAAVASYMAGLVGSSNNPVSGITIATLLVTSLLLLVLVGREHAAGPAAAILVGAVVCCAASIGGDNLQDLKAGYLVGATPWRQQVALAIGVLASVLFIAPILNLLLEAYGIGARTPEQPDALLAPQATLMASVAQGVLGADADLPWAIVAGGVLIGAAIIALDLYLKASGARWRAPVLAVAVGIYLPLELAVSICAGGVIAHIAARVRARRAQGADEAARHGVLVAAGLITGEALIGIFMAVPIVYYGNADVIALGVELPAVVGLVVIGAIAAALYRVATRS